MIDYPYKGYLMNQYLSRDKIVSLVHMRRVGAPARCAASPT
jgi:hypothetical protein